MENVVKRTQWDESEIEFLKKYYGVKTSKQIGKEINRTSSAVQLKARRIGLEVKSKYNYDSDFFEVIDTEEKAYWLGFIMADGCVTYDTSNRTYELSIKLKKSDHNHLRKFNKSIKGNIEVTYARRLGVFNNERYDNKKYYESSIIRVYSQKMVQDLMNAGIEMNKSHKIIKLPNLNDELLWHYIRGFLDGDGHVSVPKENNKYGYRIGFTCNCESFLIEMKEFMNKYGIVSHINKSRNTFKLEMRNKHSIIKFLQNSHNGSNIYLERKYKNYEKLIDLLSVEEI